MEKPNERLRHARIAAGYKSASAAARHFGWGDATYRHHENGTRGYGIEQAQEYAAAFNVSPVWLLDFGLMSTDSWRIPLGKFYTEAYLTELSWRPDFEEAVNNANEKLGTFLVPELTVSVDKMDVLRNAEGEAQFFPISPSLLMLPPSLFSQGKLFLYRVPTGVDGGALRVGDLLLINSQDVKVGPIPELWLMRNLDREIVEFRWARAQDDGSIMLMADRNGELSAPVESDDSVIGKVVWMSRRI